MTTPKRKEPDDDSPPKRSVKKMKQTRCVTCIKDAGDKAIRVSGVKNGSTECVQVYALMNIRY